MCQVIKYHPLLNEKMKRLIMISNRLISTFAAISSKNFVEIVNPALTMFSLVIWLFRDFRARSNKALTNNCENKSQIKEWHKKKERYDSPLVVQYSMFNDKLIIVSNAKKVFPIHVWSTICQPHFKAIVHTCFQIIFLIGCLLSFNNRLKYSLSAVKDKYV